MSKRLSKGWMCMIVLLPVPLLLGAKGCGGNVSMGSDYAGEAGERASGGGGNDEGGSAGKTSAGGSSMGGRAPDGTAAASGTAPGGAGGKAALCEGFENTAYRDEVTVRYVNDGTSPIYVGRTSATSCDGGYSFELRDAAGEPLGYSSPTEPGWSCVSCEALQGDSFGCPSICGQGVLVRIDPGGSYDHSWSGTYWTPGNMPQACFRAEGFDRCSKLIQAPPAAYRFVGKVWSDVACDEVQGCLPCTPDDSGSCIIGGAAAASGTSREVERVLDYPAEKLVELHFD
jgi:hypothetical protein